jgi:hypothetical protein
MLAASFLAGCRAPAATLSPAVPTATVTAVAATLTRLQTATPAMEIPQGLLPPALTAALLDGLYARAAAMLQRATGGAGFCDVTIEVHPFVPTSQPGTTLFVSLGLRADGAVYTYEWRDSTDEMVSRGQTHTIVSLGVGSPPGPCDPLPWHGDAADLPALVRYGYQHVHESFPANTESYYALSSSSLKTDCLWIASFRANVNGKVESVGNFFMGGSDFIIQVP